MTEVDIPDLSDALFVGSTLISELPGFIKDNIMTTFTSFSLEDHCQVYKRDVELIVQLIDTYTLDDYYGICEMDSEEQLELYLGQIDFDRVMKDKLQ